LNSELSTQEKFCKFRKFCPAPQASSHINFAHFAYFAVKNLNGQPKHFRVFSFPWFKMEYRPKKNSSNS